MRIDLYPADHESTNPIADLLDLLNQDARRLTISRSFCTALSSIRVTGNLNMLTSHVQRWLRQRVGRMAAPPSIWDEHHVGTIATVAIIFHLSVNAQARQNQSTLSQATGGMFTVSAAS